MKALGYILLVVSLICPTVTIVMSIQFNQNCSGYIKQAADANTVELAMARLGKAIEYVEDRDLTKGYTSAVYRTEDENIGFWYENMKACYSELEGCVDGTQLEKSNVLMKVRESLTDDGEKGTSLTIPSGISRYPHNLAYGIFNLLSVLLLLFSIGWLIYCYEQY